jgi:hypothetical protein
LKYQTETSIENSGTKVLKSRENELLGKNILNLTEITESINYYSTYKSPEDYIYTKNVLNQDYSEDELQEVNEYFGSVVATEHIDKLKKLSSEDLLVENSTAHWQNVSSADRQLNTTYGDIGLKRETLGSSLSSKSIKDQLFGLGNDYYDESTTLLPKILNETDVDQEFHTHSTTIEQTYAVETELQHSEHTSNSGNLIFKTKLSHHIF